MLGVLLGETHACWGISNDRKNDTWAPQSAMPPVISRGGEDAADRAERHGAEAGIVGGHALADLRLRSHIPHRAVPSPSSVAMMLQQMVPAATPQMGPHKAKASAGPVGPKTNYQRPQCRGLLRPC